MADSEETTNVPVYWVLNSLPDAVKVTMLPLQVTSGVVMGTEPITVTVTVSPLLAYVGSTGLSHDKQISTVGMVPQDVMEATLAICDEVRALSYTTTLDTEPQKLTALVVVPEGHE